ncbi:dimethylallyltransferase [Rufibacter sp. DG15C]|uniref:type 1 glutamine amidotransferase domain-containing protein n=1 Tax=Rufibacter sp. DG15C TaxID=1379909 RepID=UPI00078B6330|nr:type 1 glutamine amidotransferase domain-containing protein [Rufibacter sp. DG15C]AMM52530.1 dimethylallyltransferase [Rufibacter sp. DG15C]
MKIAMVLTSHSELGNTGEKTGFWIEEFAAPYYVFKEAGADITLASPKGGQPPIDPKSDAPENQTEATKRFKQDKELQQLLVNTSKLSDVQADQFDAVFYPGGHGPLWDLHSDKASLNLIETLWNSNKPVAAVCHAPAVLLNAKDASGQALVKDKNVTGFTNTEEEAVGLTQVVPYLLEDELKNKGGKYSKKEDWAVHVVKDGLLITGQNPASSEEAARQLISLLKENKQA